MALQRILGPKSLETVRFLLSPRHLKLSFGSAILWGLGDVGAQAITHYSVSDRRRAKESQDKDEESTSFGKQDKEFKINWHRVYSASSFGAGAWIGPAAYYRFKSLQSSMYGLQRSTPELVASAVLDGVFTTLNLATFFPFMGFWHGKNWSVGQAKEDLKRGFTPALVLGGAMVPAKLIMISRFVPAPYQLHCASLFGLVGSCSLSWIEQHRDADSWKQGFEKMDVQKRRSDLTAGF